jgi:hypothetical protein
MRRSREKITGLRSCAARCAERARCRSACVEDRAHLLRRERLRSLAKAREEGIAIGGRLDCAGRAGLRDDRSSFRLDLLFGRGIRRARRQWRRGRVRRRLLIGIGIGVVGVEKWQRRRRSRRRLLRRRRRSSATRPVRRRLRRRARQDLGEHGIGRRPRRRRRQRRRCGRAKLTLRRFRKRGRRGPRHALRFALHRGRWLRDALGRRLRLTLRRRRKLAGRPCFTHLRGAPGRGTRSPCARGRVLRHEGSSRPMRGSSRSEG